MNKKFLLTTMAAVAIGVSAKATIINFQENGSNQSLGTSSTFTEGGASLTAWAFPQSKWSSQTLYAKSAGAGETGLGITSDPTGNHEIYGSTFIQILSSTTIGFDVTSISLSSTTAGEFAEVWFSTTLGSLGTLIGTFYSNTTVSIDAAYQNGYIGVSLGKYGEPYHANVLLASATGNVVTPVPGVTVPDGGSTLMLLGGVLTGLGLIKRKLKA